MLQFYLNRGAELTVRPPFSQPLTIRSCSDLNHEAVPLTHIYVTSSHYAGLLTQSLGEQSAHLSLLPAQDADQLLNLPNFPKSFRNLGFNSVLQMHTEIQQRSKQANTPTFVLINGIGTGLGDNYAGLGVLQRLVKLLAPLKPTFCLMQELEERIAPVYKQEPSVDIRTCFMPLDQFLKFDYLIDFSTIKDMPSFDSVAAAHFNSHAFSVNKLIPSSNIQPRIHTHKEKTRRFKTHIARYLSEDKKTVLLHPLASSSLRKLPSHKAAAISKELIKQGYNVISAFDHANPPQGFLSLADQSNNIDDFIHIIDAADAVISVGTVTYHLASALGKPTVLLPTVNADIRSAKLMPEVLAWTPKANSALYMNLHKSEDRRDLDIADKIWSNVNEQPLVNALSQHIAYLNSSVGKTPIVAVVIPHNSGSLTLPACIDSLSRVQGFDPMHLYTVADPGLGVQHARYTDLINQGIEQALNNGCDYIWLLHDNAKAPPDFLTRLLNHFDHNPQLGIIGSAAKGAGTLYGQHVLEANASLDSQRANVELTQPWLTFSSALIRASTMQDVGGLNSKMQRLFCDAEFCIQAANTGWLTWQDPSLAVEFMQSERLSSHTYKHLLETELKESARAFYSKWATDLGKTNPEDIEKALLSRLGF